MRFETRTKNLVEDKNNKTPREVIDDFVEILKDAPVQYSIVLSDIASDKYTISPDARLNKSEDMGAHNNFNDAFNDLLKAVNNIVSENKIPVKVEVDKEKEHITITAKEQ